jgi:hypothetical protein
MQSDKPSGPGGRLGVVRRALSSRPRVCVSFIFGEGASFGVESEKERDLRGDFEGVRRVGGSSRRGACPGPVVVCCKSGKVSLIIASRDNGLLSMMNFVCSKMVWYESRKSVGDIESFRARHGINASGARMSPMTSPSVVRGC